MCVLEISTCCFRVYSRGLKTLNSVGRCNFIKFRINSLIPLEKRLKSLLLSKLFLRCIPSAFPGLKRIKLKQLKICCSLRQSPKTASCFEFASEARFAITSDIRDNLDILPFVTSPLWYVYK